MKVLVADDHKLTREELTRLIENTTEHSVIGEAENGEEAVKKAGALNPDVVVMDLAMPGINGIEATENIQAIHPDIRVLVISNHIGRRLVHAALARGASGYIRKDRAREELSAGIRHVLEGKQYVGEAVL